MLSKNYKLTWEILVLFLICTIFSSVLLGCGQTISSEAKYEETQPQNSDLLLPNNAQPQEKEGKNDTEGFLKQHIIRFELNLENTKNKVFCEKGFTQLTISSEEKNVSSVFLGKYRSPLLPHVISKIDLDELGIPGNKKIERIDINEENSNIITKAFSPEFANIQLGYLKYHISNSENEYYIEERLEPEIFPYLCDDNLKYYVEDISGERKATVDLNPIKRIFRIGRLWFISYYTGQVCFDIKTSKEDKALDDEYDLLIIADERYIGKPRNSKKLMNLSDYANWKEQSFGTKTKVVSLQEIFGTRYLKPIDKTHEIKKFIMDEHKKSGCKYVFLVGNFEEIPGEIVEIENFSAVSKVPSDFIFCDVDISNSEYVGEMRVGRLPVMSIEELQKYLQSVKDYCENDNDDKYYNRYLFAMGVANEMVRCHLHSRDMVEEIKKGVVSEAGSELDIDFYHIDSSDQIKSVLIEDINKFLSEVKPTFFDILDHGTVYDIAGNLGYEFDAKVPWMLYSVACDSFDFTNIYSDKKNFYQNLLFSDDSKCFAFIGNTDKSVTFPCKDTLTDSFSFGCSHEFHTEFISQIIRKIPESERTIGNLFLLSKNNRFYLGSGREDFEISFHSLNLCGDPSIVLKRSK